ncbi:hypothetical protein VNI00_016508 [Paramarasmius palmivorus]|uniref:Uncharacterized protein n=1 Tax=Paramarasmius palmivorus TaxID=297713 RepID=A0AAW0BCT8_9AGAR
MTEEPRIVQLEWEKIDAFDFRPLLDPDDQENGGTAHIKAIHTEGAPQEYRLFYFEQTARNGFPVNDCVTRELEGFTDGLRRPWLGPMLVVWDDNNVLCCDNLEEKAEEIISNVHNFYEDFIRDDGVPFNRLESESDAEE